MIIMSSQVPFLARLQEVSCSHGSLRHSYTRALLWAWLHPSLTCSLPVSLPDVPLPFVPHCLYRTPCSATRACLIKRFCTHPHPASGLNAIWETNELVVRAVDMLAISSSILDGSDASKYVCIGARYITSRSFECQC